MQRFWPMLALVCCSSCAAGNSGGAIDVTRGPVARGVRGSASLTDASAPETSRVVAPGQYVLVWGDALLHAAPRADAPVARARWTGRVNSDEGLWVFRYLGRQGPWVAVETLGKRAETTDHCYGGWDRFERLVLRLYVQHADLIPVTHRAVAIDFDSGVQVNLASGVVVLPLGSGLSGGPSHQVEVDGFSFAASLPPPVVSTTYVPGAHFDLSQPLATVEGGPVILGPRALLQTDLRRRLDVFGHVGHEPTRRYVLRTACAEYLVPARQVRTRPWEGWLEVQRRPHPLPPAYQVPGDVAVYWLDGALAGKTADVISWPRAPVVQGGRSCFRHRVGFHVDRSQEAFTLCFENDDVTSVRRGGI